MKTSQGTIMPVRCKPRAGSGHWKATRKFHDPQSMGMGHSCPIFSCLPAKAWTEMSMPHIGDSYGILIAFTDPHHTGCPAAIPL